MDTWMSKPEGELAALGAARRSEYQSGQPFPHIVLDDFFDPQMMDRVLAEAPSLETAEGKIEKFDSPNEKKLGSVGEEQFGPQTKQLMRFLNSEPFLYFLEGLTGIEHLIPDPHFEGGGHHEIRPGGFLKIHADFNKHYKTGLDRRVNVLVYLNKEWDEAYGGHFEMWDRRMTRCVTKILPVFNRMVVFSTNSYTYHGHPEPLRCPPGMSRRSLALYYYTNGRPEDEQDVAPGAHTTLFQARPGSNDGPEINFRHRAKRVVKAVTPPVVLGLAARVIGK